jgi:hypothetical protein
MGSARCEENREFPKAINLINKHANALRKAENTAESGQVKRILLSALVGCEEAVVELVRMQGQHQKKCDDCKK